MLLRIPALAGREQVAHVIRGDRAAVREQVLGREQAEDTHQATGMVGMHMRQGHEVKAAHVVLPEKRGNEPCANVEAPIIGATAINEEGVMPRHLDDNGVPCTYI